MGALGRPIPFPPTRDAVPARRSADADQGELNVNFRTAPGSTLGYTLAKGREMVAFLRKQPEVDYTYLWIGGGFRGTPNNGSIFVKLLPRSQRKRSVFGSTE